uniref:spore protease YyaC n=1 Tax=Clostridium tertium TaxID=1559 RepID=UPI003BAB46A0
MKDTIQYNIPNAYIRISNYLKKYIDENTIIVCIGTDKFIGDCLGPLVGTYLKEQKCPLPIYGTIESPIHALNIHKELKKIDNLHPNSNSNILGVDASLGHGESIGTICIRNEPIYPGRGVGKVLPKVGRTSIVGIIDDSEDSTFFSNKSIRLHFVMEMAKVIASSIMYSITIDKR